MKRLLIAGVVLASFAGSGQVWADPAEDTLEIDGVPIVTKTAAPEGHPFDEVYSGWLFREAETRDLERDTFENPGMIAVEDGEAMWNTVMGTEGKSCATCHEDAAVSMKGVGASFPKWDADSGKPINVELQINKCLTEQMGAEPLAFNKDGQQELTAYIKHQSLGMPVELDLTQGDMQSWWDRGKDVYYTRTGQLNLACASCHEVAMGKFIRADHLSQGQVNGFPTYRLKSGLTSLHQRFRGCIRYSRAEQPKAFSDDLMALETYVTWRGTGLSVETPSVRQ